ncbi:helix-turn-helix domain-containing protein [Hyphomicrobium sp.]|jgi:transcriptional regulator with XRE-family HTH domain|uniref:helix-turn-helix domain-containing protein n=1 Tax=Hyphomicrobium sp. TaxID=82 RepID=UPI002FE0874E
MAKKPVPSLRMQAELRKLGEDIAIARKKRRFTQQRLAEGAGVNVATIRRLESGDGGVSLGVLAMVMLTLGEHNRLANLLDVAKDDIGLTLDVNALPKRVRPKRSRPRRPEDTASDRTEAPSSPDKESF